jgi:hypothetical protein
MPRLRGDVERVGLQPGRNVLHVVGDFARTYCDECRALAGASPIAEAIDSYTKEMRDLFWRSEIDAAAFVLHGLMLSKTRTAEADRNVPFADTSAPIPILGRRAL